MTSVCESNLLVRLTCLSLDRCPPEEVTILMNRDELSDPGCNDDGPCDQCQGDCDNDDECADDLICFFRPGNSIVGVPGCTGIGEPGADYCVTVEDDTLRLRNPPCSSDNVCPVCVGDCTDDGDCEDGLICGQNPSDSVPGCVGTPVNGLDYCHVPERRTLLRKQ